MAHLHFQRRTGVCSRTRIPVQTEIESRVLCIVNMFSVVQYNRWVWSPSPYRVCLRQCKWAIVESYKTLISCVVSGKLSEDSLEEGSAVAGVAPRQFKSKLEEALTAKQESDAKVSTLEAKVQQYETELTEIKEKVTSS